VRVEPGVDERADRVVACLADHARDLVDRLLPVPQAAELLAETTELDELLTRISAEDATTRDDGVRSILETRLHIGPKVAELAAQRRRPELAARLDEALQKLADEDDPVERQRHALTFWDRVVDGADSIAFRLMYNTLRATYEPALDALATVMADEVGRPAAYRELADAITAGSPERARNAAQNLLEPATTGLLTAIDNLEEQR